MPHRWVEEDARRNYLRLSAGAMLAGALVGTAVAAPSALLAAYRAYHAQPAAPIIVDQIRSMRQQQGQAQARRNVRPGQYGGINTTTGAGVGAAPWRRLYDDLGRAPPSPSLAAHQLSRRRHSE